MTPELAVATGWAGAHVVLYLVLVARRVLRQVGIS